MTDTNLRISQQMLGTRQTKTGYQTSTQHNHTQLNQLLLHGHNKTVANIKNSNV